MTELTLVDGSSYCISTETGDITPGDAHGLYFRDTRVISGWRLLIDGAPPEVLATITDEPFAARFIGRRAPRPGRGTLFVERRRYVSDGMREDIVLCNLSGEDTVTRLTLLVEADLADIFAVRGATPTPHLERSFTAGDGELTGHVRGLDREYGVRVGCAPTATAAPGLLFLSLVVPAHAEQTVTLRVRPSQDGAEPPDPFPSNTPIEESVPARRMRDWEDAAPTFQSQHPTATATVDRCLADLGALRVYDIPEADGPVIAAGSPWFMTLFGRDSLLTAWMLLPVAPELALSTVRALARLQGRTVDPVTEEQPGRILHELRRGLEFPLSPGHGIYYGTIDATPLFVMLIGELARWGADPDELRELLPQVDRAMSWIEEYGDRDGDGFVEYQRSTDSGLDNQGWKDSGDSIVFADGRQAVGPIALCEVQGYVYAAYRARAELARQLEQRDGADWDQRAERLQAAFHHSFWLPDRGWFALALDGEKRPVDSLTSNIGHCLWAGIVEPTYAARVARLLTGPEMFSGWGVRTLATSMAAYDPASYHNGSVWPHDNAIVAAGLERYRFAAEARRITAAQFEAAAAFDGRLPELFCGFSREAFPTPVPYPTSCSPQAWAAGALLLMLRTSFGLEPNVPAGVVRASTILATALPAELADIALAGRRITVSADATTTTIRGLPAGIRPVQN